VVSAQRSETGNLISISIERDGRCIAWLHREKARNNRVLPAKSFRDRIQNTERESTNVRWRIDRAVMVVFSIVVKKAKRILALVRRFSSGAPQHCGSSADPRTPPLIAVIGTSSGTMLLTWQFSQ
jgi:hypothetical protein